MLGGLPLVQLDRVGVALLGTIALKGFDAVSLEEAAKSIHLPTLILLFAFMVVSAQMRVGGLCEEVTRWLTQISWRDHARIGIPVTLVTLAIAAIYLALRWTDAY